jgi:hypothetical protein
MTQWITRLAESWNYTPRADRAPGVASEHQTVFRLRPMTGPERAAAHDDVTRTVLQGDGSTAVVSRERQVARQICINHIEAITNPPAGAPATWPDDRAARERYLDGFDDELIREIGDEVFTRSAIGVAEKKSSPPEST